MSGDDHARALELSKKTKTVKETDGSTTDLNYYDDDLLRCYIIYFQLLNENGERVFTNLTDIDDNGRPIYQAKDLVANLSKMADVVNGLSKLEDLVKKEQQTLSANRGGVVVNKYSQ